MKNVVQLSMTYLNLSFNVLKETQHQRMEGRFTVNENQTLLLICATIVADKLMHMTVYLQLLFFYQRCFLLVLHITTLFTCRMLNAVVQVYQQKHALITWHFHLKKFQMEILALNVLLPYVMTQTEKIFGKLYLYDIFATFYF